jgi:hypothetical protein
MRGTRLSNIGLGVLAIGAVVFGVVSAASAARPPAGGGGGPIYCLDVWKPVICSNGIVYSNDCYARRAGATGCVPYGAM